MNRTTIAALAGAAALAVGAGIYVGWGPMANAPETTAAPAGTAPEEEAADLAPTPEAPSATPMPTGGDLASLITGEMNGLVLHEDPQPVPAATFVNIDEEEGSLADYAGQYVVLNFWATWCAPCRHEMPSLQALQTELGGEDFAVVTLAVGRNPPEGIRRFFEEEEIETLPTWRDTDQTFARAMSIFGLPITVILDREGREIARYRGDADWASDDSFALMRALIAGEAG